MPTSSNTSRPRRPSRSLTSTLILAALIFGYALLQPKLESWLGDDARPADGGSGAETRQSRDVPTRQFDTSDRGTASTSSAPAPPSTTLDTTDEPILETGSAQPSPRESATPKLGELRDMGGNVFQSTAGLHYRQGSQEGHRVKHVLRHHADAPERPVHGVFDGDRNEVFAVIDEAYLYTFDHGPPRVTTEKDEGRTIYRVDLGRRIGYVGGQSGRRQGHPAAHHVQLILEGTSVITAYPVRVHQRRD